MKPEFLRYFLLYLFLLFAGFELSAQTDDTVRVHIQNNVYDTVIIHETVLLYDTIWKDPIINSYSTGFMFSPFFTTWRKFNNPVISLSKQKNYSIGIDAELEIDRWIFSSGLYFTEFNQNARFDFTVENIDTLNITQIIPHNETHYDTTGVTYELVTYDSIYINPSNINDTVVITITDSVPHYDIDTTVVTYNDTVNTAKIDTISRDTIAARNFVYRYTEIPLIFKFRFAEFGKFQIDIGAGFIAGFLIKYESFGYNSSTRTIIAHNKDDIHIFLPSLWLSAGINYHISDNFSIRLEPYYNPGLRSIYAKELAFIKIPDRYGLKFGIRYNFN